MIGSGNGVTACTPSTDEGADSDQEADLDDDDDDNEDYDPGEVVVAVIVVVTGVPAAGQVGHLVKSVETGYFAGMRGRCVVGE